MESATARPTAFDCSASSLRMSALTPEADRLSNALAVVIELYATLSAVHDILRAEKALEGLRAAA